MRVLFISPRQSWPAVSGARLRDYYFAKALGSRTQLTYAYFSDRGRERSAGGFPFCERVVAIPAPQMYTAGKVLRGMFGRWPLTVVNYSSPAMTEAVRKIVSGNSFDLVHLDSMHMAPYVPLLGGAPVVYNWHNIESELMTRYAENAPSFAHRIYGALTARRIAALEKELLQSAFGHLVCSQREKDQLLEIAPEARIAVIENGVDTEMFSGGTTNGTKRTRVVFVGSMSYHANIEAAVWFTHEIWPEIHRRFPQWSLSLVGSTPAPAVLALRGQSVEVTGTVPSVTPYYENALAAIVPLRTGGGTRLKILEAMAAGVPVISTTLGAEGLAVSPGKDILIADRQDAWIEALGSISGDEALWNRLADNGRSLVESHYDWRVLGEKLFETYRDWLRPQS